MSLTATDLIVWLNEHERVVSVLVAALVAAAAAMATGARHARTRARCAAGGTAALSCLAAAAILIWAQDSRFGAWWRHRLVEAPMNRFTESSFTDARWCGDAATIAWLQELSAADDPSRPPVAQIDEFALHAVAAWETLPARVSESVRRAMLDRMEVEARNALERSRMNGTQGRWFSCESVMRVGPKRTLQSGWDVQITSARLVQSSRLPGMWRPSHFQYGVLIRSVEWRTSSSDWRPWPTSRELVPHQFEESRVRVLLRHAPEGGDLDIRLNAAIVITMDGSLEWRTVPLDWQGTVRLTRGE